MKTNLRNTLLMAPLMAGMMATAALPAPAAARDNVEKAQEAMAKENADKAVSYAERAVVEQPRDPAMRVLLGEAYLKAGRMMSARESLSAAVELGDASPRTALMLALAQVGSGDMRLAVGTINMQGSAIPAADRGLALALAGDTARGVEIISETIRSGNNTPKSRQNLAYAFALDGRWREARAMAEQDVPAGEIGQRMTEWAANARPDLYAQRVAALMGSQVSEDEGMPQHLALSKSAPPLPVAKPAPQMAAAPVTPAPAKPAPVAAKPEPAPVKVAMAEPKPEAVKPAPVPAKPAPAAEPKKAEPAPVRSSSRQVALAVIQPLPSSASETAKPEPKKPEPVVVAALAKPATPATAKPAPASAKPEPVRTAAVTPAAKPAPKPAAKPAPKPQLPAIAATGTHIAQLGSYGSEDAAQAGWKVFQSRYANLRGAKPVVTKATVDGKDYWRVAAGGLDAKGATAMCAAVKASGNGCLPIAQANGTGAAPKARLANADRLQH